MELKVGFSLLTQPIRNEPADIIIYVQSGNKAW